MPRPIRIEYPNAIYHVMNRGRGRCDIFHGQQYYQSFLQSIEEAFIRFGLIVHAYCLMSNHYHLLVETPNANLGRIMRHINSTYTQRYNRLRKTDGPLFRGRYKAILVEESEYLLALSRYIHRNPIETKNPLVSNLKDYRWSSYSNYLSSSKKSPDWLDRTKTLEMFGGGVDPIQNYETYVSGLDESNLIGNIYQKNNMPVILGTKSFKERILFERLDSDRDKRNQVLDQVNKNRHLNMDKIINLVAKIFAVERDFIVKRQSGRKHKNRARALAMFVCQEFQDMKLSEIAIFFDLASANCAGKSICDIRKYIKAGDMKQQLDEIRRCLKLIVVS
jgi:REP element-mobilizing transposase RayT